MKLRFWKISDRTTRTLLFFFLAIPAMAYFDTLISQGYHSFGYYLWVSFLEFSIFFMGYVIGIKNERIRWKEKR